MNNEQFFHKLRTNFEHGLELMKRKNHDYASEEDCFKNFRASEMLGLTVEEGILVRMSDKMARVANLLKTKNEGDYTDARVNESVTDTLADLMNYSNILMTYLQRGEEVKYIKRPECKDPLCDRKQEHDQYGLIDSSVKMSGGNGGEVTIGGGGYKHFSPISMKAYDGPVGLQGNGGGHGGGG